MSIGSVISYPIPPYQNVPIHPEYYKPRRFVISDITLGIFTIVTTTENMDYEIGQEIRLLIPSSFGCYQLNEVTGFVIDIPALNQVKTNIDSLRNVDPYISSSDVNKAQIVAIGDINNGYVSFTGKDIPNPGIPGSFQNISPQ